MQSPFAPAPRPCLAAPSVPAERDRLLALLEQLPSYFAPASPPNRAANGGALPGCPCASQAGLLAAIDLAKSNGGKIHFFVAEPADVGAHTVRLRHHGGGPIANGEAELGMAQPLLSAPDLRWRSAASQAADASICVDVLLLTQVRRPTSKHNS